MALAFATPAKASVIETWTGFASGTDLFNWSGLGNVITNQPYVATFTFDCALPDCTNVPASLVRLTIGGGNLLDLIDLKTGTALNDASEVAGFASGFAQTTPESFTEELFANGTGIGTLAYGTEQPSPLSLTLIPTGASIDGVPVTP
jgi:hypothetical protein